MKKLLPFKIRPFNMANFSGGSGYLIFYYILILLFTYPLYFVISLPLTLIEAHKNGTPRMVDTKKVKTILKFIYLPIAAVASVVLTVVYSYMGFIYDPGGFAWVAYFYCAASPFVIIFAAITVAVNRKKDDEGNIRKSEFIGYSLLFVLLFSIPAFVISIIFSFILG